MPALHGYRPAPSVPDSLTCGTCFKGGKPFDSSNSLSGGGVNQLVEVPCQLQIKPELCFHAKELLKTKCRVRSDPPLAMDQFVDPHVGYSKFCGQFYL